MAITIREQQDNGSNSVGLSFTLGAGTVTTDTLVLLHADDFYTAADLLTPTGTAASTWTLRHTMDGGTNSHHCKVWTAPVTTAGAQTVVANSTNVDEERYAGVFVLQDAPVFDTAASSAAQAASTDHVAPSVTPTAGKTDDQLICLWFTNLSNYTIPGSMTPYTERDVGGVVTFRAASEQLTTDSATGTRTATIATSETWSAVSVLVKSATAPPPAPNLIVTRSNLQLR